MDGLIWDSPSINTWIKNRHGKYLKVSEGFARQAGADSPAAAVGCDDSALIWRNHVEQIRLGDRLALSGIATTNASRTMKTKFGEPTILLNKHAEKGVIVGCAIDITGRVMTEQKGRWDLKTGVFLVGDIELSKREVDVVRLLLLGQPVKIIAVELHAHEKTIEQRIGSLRKKFNAKNKFDLVRKIHGAGLGYLASVNEI